MRLLANMVVLVFARKWCITVVLPLSTDAWRSGCSLAQSVGYDYGVSRCRLVHWSFALLKVTVKVRITLKSGSANPFSSLEPLWLHVRRVPFHNNISKENLGV